eukprot:1901994-Prymnesium_polylepis.1
MGPAYTYDTLGNAQATGIRSAEEYLRTNVALAPVPAHVDQACRRQSVAESAVSVAEAEAQMRREVHLRSRAYAGLGGDEAG